MKYTFAMLFLISIAPTWTDAKTGKPAKLTYGILMVPIVGLGGETTGIGINTPDGTKELILPKEFREGLESFDQKLISVDGKATTLSGVTTKDRPAIRVNTLSLHPRLSSLEGTVMAVVASGGETSGYELDVPDKTDRYEIIFAQSQRDLVQSFVGKKVNLVGKTTTIKGKEVHDHPGVYLESITAAD